MANLRLGIVGYRGMVGSVLIERMLAEKDFKHFNTSLFSTSQAGSEAPSYSSENKVFDATNLMELAKMDIILTCQGGDYTKAIYAPLRKLGWGGYWIDAASALRMEEEAVLVLDPVNLNVIKAALKEGKKTYVGANCTVSLMLLALDGLFKRQAIEWVSSMTYQAASGAGAKNMRELLAQMQNIGDKLRPEIDNVAGDILALEKEATQLISSDSFPTENFGHPLALNLLPWIDLALPTGQSKEEWKAQVEANKIMATKKTIPVDGTCVRVSALRCHSQGLTVKLNQKIPLNEIEGLLKDSHQWLKFVDNNKEATLKELCPKAISGTLDIGIGRVRKMTLGDDFLNVFTVGDQLLWGAAEPLRRMLHLINESN